MVGRLVRWICLVELFGSHPLNLPWSQIHHQIPPPFWSPHLSLDLCFASMFLPGLFVATISAIHLIISSKLHHHHHNLQWSGHRSSHSWMHSVAMKSPAAKGWRLDVAHQMAFVDQWWPRVGQRRIIWWPFLSRPREANVASFRPLLPSPGACGARVMDCGPEEAKRDT